MAPRILIILHQEHSSPGRVGQALVARGFELDERRPRFDDPLPETMDDHAGAVIFGGPMSANDPEEYVRREIDWIGVALKAEKPFLGLCLGAQMLARHLGAAVSHHAEGRVEIGYHPILPTEAGRELMTWPDQVYQWHNEGFEAPAGATVLAEGDHFPVQAIRVGPAAYGLQFHPELTAAMMYRWTVRGAHRFGQPGAQDRAEQVAGRFLHDPPLRRFLDDFLDVWLKDTQA
jgi:GMP synthase (glutamine-hydrolysing)